MKLKDFSRIENAVDVNLIKNTHIVGVGAGGAYSFYQSMARCGIGKLSVIDFDTVEEANVVRQGYDCSDIGIPKIEALCEHIQRVNGSTIFNGISKNIFDMTEKELDSTFGEADLFLFMTDSFAAQAYGNELALRYKKPAIWGGFYEKSQCAELVFTIPGVTPACFRCAVSPRYKIQSSSTNEIKVSSNCNTIFHSHLLDSFIGMLSLAILHNNSEGYEYSNWFGKKWNKNLIQIKVHPSYGTLEGSLFHRTFKETENRCPNFNAIWQTIEEEKPPKYDYCPDCGGTGNLLNSNPQIGVTHG